MKAVTRSRHTRIIALLLVVLALSSVSVAGVTEIPIPDERMQTCHEEANPVALIRYAFVLEISMASTYLSPRPGEVLRRAPLILSHANRGPPSLSS
jgi:hypothetical protein